VSILQNVLDVLKRILVFMVLCLCLVFQYLGRPAPVSIVIFTVSAAIV